MPASATLRSPKSDCTASISHKLARWCLFVAGVKNSIWRASTSLFGLSDVRTVQILSVTKTLGLHVGISMVSQCLSTPEKDGSAFKCKQDVRVGFCKCVTELFLEFRWSMQASHTCMSFTVLRWKSWRQPWQYTGSFLTPMSVAGCASAGLAVTTLPLPESACGHVWLWACDCAVCGPVSSTLIDWNGCALLLFMILPHPAPAHWKYPG